MVTTILNDLCNDVLLIVYRYVHRYYTEWLIHEFSNSYKCQLYNYRDLTRLGSYAPIYWLHEGFVTRRRPYCLPAKYVYSIGYPKRNPKPKKFRNK